MTSTAPLTQPLLQTPRIHFDFGAVASLGVELERLAMTRPMFVTDATLVAVGVFDQALAALPADPARAVVSDVPPNPTVAAANRCLTAYRANDCDGFVAVGGGSVIDCAKAAAVLATHGGELSQYLGHPERITTKPASLIAIPTTGGSGSEVSRGCGIHPNDVTRGLGINHALMVPPVAICDPALTLSLPKSLTAGTGLDALSHCVEGFLAKSINMLVDAIALDGIRRLVAHIEVAVADGSDRTARWNVMLGAIQGGLSITKGLGPAHAIANTCGDRGLHHGMLSTVALPPVLRLYEATAPDKLPALADALGCRLGQSAADAVEALNRRCGLPASIAALGYGQADLDELAADAAASFFNAPAPYRPTLAQYRDIMQLLMT